MSDASSESTRRNTNKSHNQVHIDARTAEFETASSGSEESPDDQPTEILMQSSFDFLEPSSHSGHLGRLGHYEVIDVLGQGSFGIVLRAFDEKLHRSVAIKVLAPQLASTSPPRKRFLREARAVASIKHENVVQIYSVEEQPIPYFVMECVDGKTLQQLFNETGPLTIPQILDLGQQMARGLAASHERGLIHRDIKPANILIESGVRACVKLTDFGLARAAEDASLTRTGAIAGTPMYMAPEQAQGKAIDHRADLFSLGSVLYQAACGRPPFRGDSAFAVLKRVVDEPAKPIQEIFSEVPSWLCTLIDKLHQKDPSQRYQSANDVAQLLERCAEQFQAGGQVLLDELQSTPKMLTSRQTIAKRLAIGFIALLCMCGVGWFVVRPMYSVPARPDIEHKNVENDSSTSLAPMAEIASVWPYDLIDGREYGWSPPENLGPDINSKAMELIWGISEDERTIYYQQRGKLEISHREHIDRSFSKGVSVPRTQAADGMGAVAANGLVACLVRKSQPSGEWLIWLAHRSSTQVPFPIFELAGSTLNEDGSESHPVISSDGLTMVTCSTRAQGGFGDLWMFARNSLDEPFGSAEHLGPTVNTAHWDMPYYVSNDRRFLIASLQYVTDQNQTIREFRWHQRASLDAEFSAGVSLELPKSLFENSSMTSNLRLSGDCRTLYLSAPLSSGNGEVDIWLCRRKPVRPL